MPTPTPTPRPGVDGAVKLSAAYAAAAADDAPGSSSLPMAAYLVLGAGLFCVLLAVALGGWHMAMVRRKS
ncbi:MAG: hypothetical protein QME71_03895 [Dehalococcoidia bacterium]|nr:hypothetical protein [Dehalococcoidia bacterium]